MAASREGPAPLHGWFCRTSSERLSWLLRGGPACAWLRLSGIEIVPVHDRVEPERVGPLRLPAPERPDRKHDDVSLAERGIECRRAVGEELAIEQRARQQHVVRIRRELDDDARARLVDRDPELLRHLTQLCRVVGWRTLASPARRLP